MKRFSSFLIVVLSIFALVACSNVTQGDQPQKPVEQKELSATDVMKKMIEKTQSQSYKMEGTVDQKIGQMNNKISVTTEASPDPAIVHMKMALMGIEIEMYVDKQFIYMHDPYQKKWGKIPLTGGAGSYDPMKQLEMLQSLFGANKEVVQLEKSNGEYVVTLDLAKVANEPVVKQLVNQALQSNANPEMAKETQKVLEQLKLNTLKYIYHVDQNTFELKKYESVIKAEAVQGDTLDQKASFNVSKLDQKVTIPKEVKQAELISQ